MKVGRRMVVLKGFNPRIGLSANGPASALNKRASRSPALTLKSYRCEEGP